MCRSSQMSFTLFLLTLIVLFETGSTFNHENRHSEWEDKSILDKEELSYDDIEDLDDIKPEKSVAKFGKA